mgnify:FL=1
MKHGAAGWHWINRYDGGPHEANFLKLDCSKVKKVFGWKPHFHVEEAMAATVEWSKKWLAGADMREVTDEQIRAYAARFEEKQIDAGGCTKGVSGSRQI